VSDADATVSDADATVSDADATVSDADATVSDALIDATADPAPNAPNRRRRAGADATRLLPSPGHHASAPGGPTATPPWPNCPRSSAYWGASCSTVACLDSAAR